MTYEKSVNEELIRLLEAHRMKTSLAKFATILELKSAQHYDNIVHKRQTISLGQAHKWLTILGENLLIGKIE